MSFLIKNAVIHELHCNPVDELAIHLNNRTLALNSTTEALVNESNLAFKNKTGSTKGYGTFTEDSKFLSELNETLEGKTPFLNFSTTAGLLLKEELSRFPFAEEGALLIAHYTDLATDFLLICVIPHSNSFKLNSKLELAATEHLNIDKMDIAVRIDISTMQTCPDSNRYISFTKGRVGRRIGDFFLDLLDAKVGLNPKVQNQIMTQALDDYCQEGDFTKEDRSGIYEQTFNYCSEKLKAGEEAVVDDLSKELPVNAHGHSFGSYAERNGYEIAEQFPVDQSTIKKLNKFYGAGGGINISFDSALLNERVTYDLETDVLSILGTPPNLKEQLKSRLKQEVK